MKKILTETLDLYRSQPLTQNQRSVQILKPRVDFLLVSHSNYGSISYRFVARKHNQFVTGRQQTDRQSRTKDKGVSLYDVVGLRPWSFI